MTKATQSPQHHLFQEQLRKTREEAGVGQRELARRLGKHHTFVGLCETGQRQLTVLELRDWCLALGISWVDFTREVDALLAQIDDSQPTEQSI
jgi:transcriptional regulator with XRE-family HTH domain